MIRTYLPTTAARALIALLDACDDSGSWTSDLARAWWLHPGSQILEAARRDRQESRDEPRETSTHTLGATA